MADSKPKAKQADDQTAAVIVTGPGTVDQAKADKDAKRRNDELTEAGVISDRGYIGSAASDLQA